MRNISTNIADIEIYNDGIFIVNYKSHVEITLEDVKMLEKIFHENLHKFNKEKVKLLSVAGKYSTITPEAREYSQVMALPLSAEGLVTYSLGQKLIAGFYLKFKKNSHPIKVFNSKEQAIDWLNIVA